MSILKESAASIYNSDCFFDDYKKAINLPETDIVIIATYANAHLIKMIEDDAEAKPTLSEVFRAFEVCMKADKKIRAGL